MPLLHAPRTVASIAAALIVTAVVGVAVASGDRSPRAPEPSSIPSAVAATPAHAPTEVAAPTAPETARDGRVAFWEERVAEGGGYESAVRLVDALLERARATGDLADVARASAALDEVEPAAPPNDAGLPERRGRVAYALHDFAAAVAAAEEVLAIDPTSAPALALLGDASLELGREADADAAYAELAERGRGPAVLSRLARRAWMGGEIDRAETLVHEAIQGSLLVGSEDERAFYHYQLGEMLRWRNALPEAESSYRMALDLQPDHAPSMGGLALVLEATGERAEAIRLLEAATARLPAPDLVAALGDLYALDGRDDDAEDQWALVERIAEVAVAEGGVHDRQLALFLADHDRDAERAAALAEAEIAERQDVYGWDALAWALHAAGRDEEADAAITEALRLGTPDGRLRYHAGMIALALGRTDQAREHLTAARAADAALPPLQVPRLEAALAELQP